MRETLTLAGGCFWCTEAIFRRLSGVLEVTPGYTGGTTDNPTYEEVCSGQTGHAEAIQIEFDPALIDTENLLEVFFGTHDSTTLNRQGNDVGTQYRSGVYYRNEEQKLAAEKIKSTITNCVTEIVPFTNFYKAEDYHQKYYESHKDSPYCSIVIGEKIKKLNDKFPDKLAK